MDEYFTEQYLGVLLSELYPHSTFIYNRAIPDLRPSLRPDFRSEDPRIICEFDGYGHYCNPKVIIKDYWQNTRYAEMGYNMVRIPYFIQMHQDVIFDLFGINRRNFNSYQHGFINNMAKLPASFCELGVKRFLDDLERFDYLKEHILNSLRIKVIHLQNELLVMPPSLLHLL